ncbi:MAG: recombinase family protein [Lachnospiraceae bacterium]|nr:recombinase family protein [Lachnospiraceae bacterium]
MARTSKKRKPEQMPEMAKRFHVGIYARLSVDGCKAGSQSEPSRKNESIDTQIEIARQYLKEHPEMELYDCYTDLGKTGTNFKREGFERMMQDVRKKRIDCIIVKDLSRFGRNHIETGNYIQKIFPFMGVRFIAVTDGIDTFGPKANRDDMTINLKNLVNEMYARDIAEKVKSSKRSKQEQGSYTGGIPAYGYQAKWVDGKKCLYICPETAEIVKEIYGMYLSGKNMKQIVEMLYEKGLHRPSDYRKTSHIYRQEGEVLEQWSRETVKRLLTNPVYMGCLVQGTTSGRQYQIRNRHDVERDDFSICYNTHEGIVSEEQFFRVAAMFEKSAAKYCNNTGFSKKVPKEEDIYAGILFCGDCGKEMSRVANAKSLSSGDMIRYYGYHCRDSRRIDGKYCPAKSIGLSVLNELVKKALNQEFRLSALYTGRLEKECEKQTEDRGKILRQEIIQCERQLMAGKKQGSELYIKYHTGSLSLEEFQKRKKKNEKSLHTIMQRKSKLEIQFHALERKGREKSKLLRSLLKCDEKTAFTSEVIRALIRRIDVYADHRVKITFAFRMSELFHKGGEEQ